MNEKIPATDLVAVLRRGVPLLDVRSPAEHAAGRIPGAVNLPLFSDEERHRVGLTYKTKGPSAAQDLGLEFVGSRLRALAEEGRRAAPDGEVVVHCWRGGQRSASVAWLLGFTGLRVTVLDGGYKAWRRLVLETFARPRRLRVLAGFTGSGKTRVLRTLAAERPVLDLEGLARHRGSAFGSLGLGDGPTQEQFENELARRLLDHDASSGPDAELVVEDESRKIGRLTIPEPVFQRMQKAPVTWLESAPERRRDRITAEYGGATADELAAVVGRIENKLGGARAADAVRRIRAGDLAGAVTLLLTYYDAGYRFSFERRGGPALVTERWNEGPP